MCHTRRAQCGSNIQLCPTGGTWRGKGAELGWGGLRRGSNAEHGEIAYIFLKIKMKGQFKKKIWKFTEKKVSPGVLSFRILSF